VGQRYLGTGTPGTAAADPQARNRVHCQLRQPCAEDEDIVTRARD
jgi:hypothetical protein